MSSIQNILLDRDGTLIEDRHYLGQTSRIALLPGVMPTLRSFIDNGCRLYMVTNQSGIGRGYFTSQAYTRVQLHLHQLFAQQGIFFTATAHCPHAPEEGCCCRKPRPGMWHQLAEKHGLDPNRSLMIGDKMSDVLFAANAALAASVLVLTGQGREEAQGNGLPTCAASPWQAVELASSLSGPSIVARDISAAADWLREQGL